MSIFNRRSLLYVPGNTEKMMEKSLSLESDGIIFDLEDAVSLTEKEFARENVAKFLSSMTSSAKEFIVRINPLNTYFGIEDLLEIVKQQPDAIIIPKAELKSLITVDEMLNTLEPNANIELGSIKLIPLIETVKGVNQINQILENSERIIGVHLGGEDLTNELGVNRTKKGDEIFFARSKLIYAAKEKNLDIIDCPYTDFRDNEGLSEDTKNAKALGVTGKVCIHPKQIPIINSIFTPEEAEIKEALLIQKSFNKAKENNKGVCSVNGKMVDLPILKRAQNTLEVAERIGIINKKGDFNMTVSQEETKQIQAKEEIEGLINRAKTAQAKAENFTQEEARRVAACIGWLAVNKAEKWAEFNFEETGMGDVQSKINRTNARARGIMRDIKHAKTVGVVEVDEEKQITKIAKPVGVIGGLVPTTVPAGVVFIKSMNALLGRNAIVFSPHPRAKKTTNMVVNDIRKLLSKMNLPEDLVLCIETPSMAKTQELMKQSDLIVATGGGPMVKAAYSSGTPAYGVGAGNVVTVVDETADLSDVAAKISSSQKNDLAIGCSTENSAIIHESVYDNAIEEMIKEGAYFCNKEEKQKLQNTLFKDGHLNPEVIVKPATYIAEKSGFSIPEDRTWLIVEEEGYGAEHPFSGEKLSVVVALYKYKDFDDAIKLTNDIQNYSGAGHSCGIHSFDDDKILKFSEETKTSRVAVRMAQNHSNAGNWNNGMPFTITLGCGTWGGNIASENITWKHYINTTWVAREIENYTIPTDEELFGDVMNEEKLFE
ncbi:aldolase/citrate lyase family protein [Staphylococcus equorum]